MASNYHLIPAELQALPQWVVWRAVELPGGRMTKPLYQPKNPQYKASVLKRDTWGTFEEAVNATIWYPDAAHGIGFVFTAEDDYFGLDIDDEAEVAPEHLSQRREFVAAVQNNMFTYCERSPSGKGLHYIGRGKANFKGRRSTALKIELYAKDRFFTMTGEQINEHGITDQQPFLNAFFANYSEELEDMTLLDTTTERSLDLDDKEVLERAARNPSFMDYYHARKGHMPGEWSTTFFFVLAELDRVTGSVEQVRRILFNSPLVLESPAAPNGETRLAKATRTFEKDLQRARRGNENGQYSLYHVNAGRQIYENMKAFERKRAEEEIAKLNAPEITRGRIDQLLEYFPEFEPYYARLTLPPGFVGNFVAAAARASKIPALKFAIPSTLAALSGLLGRRYKLGLGGGINLNFILAAPPASGKSVSISVWESVINQVYFEQYNQLQGEPNPPQFAMATSSIQGVWSHFMKTPSAVWFCDEAGGMVNAMQEGTNEGAKRLKQAFNSLYDASKHHKVNNPVASAEGSKRGDKGIRNLNISTYWAMTHSQLKITEDDITDGFLSRVIVVYDDKHEDKKVRDSEIVPFGDNERNVIATILGYLKQLNDAYAISEGTAYENLVMVDASQISEFAWDVEKRVEEIAMKANKGDLPNVYCAVSRIHSNAMRIAGLLAVMENQWSPSITEEHFKWAFGYLLFNLANVLRAVDSGELGSGKDDEMLALVRAMRLLLKKPENREGVQRSVLRDALKGKPAYMKRTDIQSMAKQITAGIDHAVKEGIIAINTEQNPKGGRPRQLVVPNLDDPIWNQA
ncbi:DNA primase protein [Rhizobium phage RHph_X3_2]|nr:DNA primase protein [Rhizobium phage RHph_X3_2]